MYSASLAAAQYKKIGSESAIEGASPHMLVQMLMNSALERLVQAKSAMERNDIALKGTLIGKATTIIAALQGSLERKHAPDLVDNLDRLYDYMQRRLFEANLNNKPAMIDEVSELMRTVKSAWDEIAPSSVAAT